MVHPAARSFLSLVSGVAGIRCRWEHLVLNTFVSRIKRLMGSKYKRNNLYFIRLLYFYDLGHAKYLFGVAYVLLELNS